MIKVYLNSFGIRYFVGILKEQNKNIYFEYASIAPEHSTAFFPPAGTIRKRDMYSHCMECSTAHTG